MLDDFEEADPGTEAPTTQPATPPAEPVQGQPPDENPPPRAADYQPQPQFDAKPWGEVADKFKEAFPTLDPKMMENKYNIARKLAMTRATPSQGTTGITDTLQGAVPFAGPASRMVSESAYQGALQRIKDGNPRDENSPNYNPNWGPTDYEIVADHEKATQERADRGLAANVGLGTLGAARFTGEQVAGGVVGKTLGLGWMAAKALGLGAAAASQAGEMAAERASAKGDNSRFYSPENIVPAASMSGVQALIFHGAGRWTQGVANPIVKAAADIATQFPAMQGTEAAAGALDNFLSPAWRTNTQYGVIGKIIQGEKGEALQETVSQVLTIAAMSLLHSGGRKIPERIMGMINEGINGEAKPEPPPEPPPGETPEQEAARKARYEEYRQRFRQEQQQRQRDRQSRGPDEAAEGIRSRVHATAEDILGVRPMPRWTTSNGPIAAARWRLTPTVAASQGQFEWVDWAYKTLEARAGRGKNPRSRPPGEWNPNQPPPYEPEQPAKTAAEPEAAPEAPPSPPGAAAAEQPLPAESAVPEPVPEGIKARYEDAQRRLQQAKAADDFEAQGTIERDIASLESEHPRLREIRPKTVGEAVEAAVNPPEGQSPERVKADQLEAQVRVENVKLHQLKALERREHANKVMGLPHEHEAARESRKTQQKKVADLQERLDAARDELMAKPVERPGGPYANTPHMQRLIAESDEIRKGLPPVPAGHTRLWRGERPNQRPGQETRFYRLSRKESPCRSPRVTAVASAILMFPRANCVPVRYNPDEPNAWNLPAKLAGQAKTAKAFGMAQGRSNQLTAEQIASRPWINPKSLPPAPPPVKKTWLEKMRERKAAKEGSALASNPSSRAASPRRG